MPKYYACIPQFISFVSYIKNKTIKKYKINIIMETEKETTYYEFSLADYYNPKQNNICSAIYNIVNDFLDITLKQIDNNLLVGGYKRINKKVNKSKKIKLKRFVRSKKTNKTLKLIQKGGMANYIVLFAITMLLLAIQVNGVINVTKGDVEERLMNTAGEVSKIFENRVGTCALNTLLWLKVIDLPTFEQKSVEMITGKSGLNSIQMSELLHSKYVLGADWTRLTLDKSIIDNNNISDREKAEEYINMIKQRLIQLRRQRYGTEKHYKSYHILNPMAYPVKNDKNGHAVVVWLMPANEDIFTDELEDNDIAIIDLQTFAGKPRPVIYKSGLSSVNKNIRKYGLTGYVMENIDFKNNNAVTKIYESVHTEIFDSSGNNELTINNNNLFDTIDIIQQTLMSYNSKNIKGGEL